MGKLLSIRVFLVAFNLSIILMAQTLVAVDVEMLLSLTRVNETLWTAKSKAASGEDIYLGFELVDESNRENWRRFGQQTEKKTHKNRASFSVHAVFSDPKSGRDDGNSDPMYTGLSNAEYAIFLHDLCTKKMYEKSKLEVFDDIYSAANGFNLRDRQTVKGVVIENTTFVAYISKEPIKDKFVFPEDDEKEPRFMSIKDYNEAYKNLVMAMQVNDTQGDTYEHLSIFRNPTSYIEGNYKGISDRLHVFTCMVMSKYFYKKSTKIESLSHMTKMLKAFFAKDPVVVFSIKPAEYGFYEDIQFQTSDLVSR